jgi:hypothetical protein
MQDQINRYEELEEVICAIFNDPALEEQPRYVVEMGCGDGALLRSVYEAVCKRTVRGKALERYPLHLLGIDFSEKTLEASALQLADLPCRLIRGEIGDPEGVMASLALEGIDTQEVLHIRSFQDHARSFVAPEGEEAERQRLMVD